MRKSYEEKLEESRLRKGPFASPKGSQYGVFRFSLLPGGSVFTVIADFGDPELEVHWEHVSVSLPARCPTWDEMCKIKDLFFEPDEWVVQFHPPASEHISNHRYCLHLWRPIRDELPIPPAYAVGIKELGELDTPEKRATAEVMRRELVARLRSKGAL